LDFYVYNIVGQPLLHPKMEVNTKVLSVAICMLYPGGYNASPGIQALKWRIFSPLWTFLVKKIESSIKVELLEHLRG
jgi:hypothetical protein